MRKHKRMKQKDNLGNYVKEEWEFQGFRFIINLDKVREYLKLLKQDLLDCGLNSDKIDNIFENRIGSRIMGVKKDYIKPQEKMYGCGM